MGGPGSIFGFAEFVAALALLLVVYTVSDVRYRFRISVAPLPIYPLTFGSIVLIGFGSLLIDVWYAEGWPTLPGIVGQAGLQALLGLVFLAVVCLWMTIAFVWPPRFGRLNASKYAHALYRHIVRGAEADLSVIADEVGRSANSLVAYCPQLWDRQHQGKTPHVSQASRFASDILLLIGNRPFCRQIAKDSPHTAILIFDAMAKAGKYRLPLGQFAQNVASEALINEDSILFHETDEFSSDLIGEVKPFSRTFFGNFDLVEALTQGAHSPLALQWWRGGTELTARQYDAYCAALETLIRSYIAGGHYGQHPQSIIRGLEVIGHLTSDLYTLNDAPKGHWDLEPTKRLRVAVDFVKAVITILDEAKVAPNTPVKLREPWSHQFDLYDRLADIAFEMIVDAAPVDGEPNWAIHYNLLWGPLHSFAKGSSWRQFRRRLHRRLYDEIRQMEDLPNYKGARVVGFLLNVLGVQVYSGKGGWGRDWRALHIVLVRWVRAHYLQVRNELPDVADAVLVGGISLDEPNGRLVKTYAKGLSREPAKHYLDLTPPEGAAN